MVIVDECHHMAADSFSIVMRELKAKYVFGLTATIKRKDKKEKIVYALLGKPFSNYDPALLALNRHIQQFIHPHFTTSHLPLTDKNLSQNNFTELVNFVIQDKDRNTLILNDLIQARKDRRRILVASSRIEHVASLSLALEKQGIKTIVLHGALKDNERNQRIAYLNSEEAINDNPIVLGTTQYIKEGSDFPSLDTLFIVTPLSWSENVKQLLGRIARAHKDKTSVEVHDYVDLEIPLFERSYSKRLSTYYKLGYTIKNNASVNKEDCLFSEIDILSALLTSLEEATTNIIISCPSIVPNKSTKRILSAIPNIPVQFIRTPNAKEEYKEIETVSSALLAEHKNFIVSFINHPIPYFITIDSKEIWYGSINFMNINPNCDNLGTALHLYDKTLASRLERQELFI